MWGWFLHQGVVDPLGGINSLWPIFGIANQLLAVLALALGATALIRMGRARCLWATLLPLGWLTAVTMTAGVMKTFSPAPLGFPASARSLSERILAGGAEVEMNLWRAQLPSNQINAAVTGVFLLLVATVVLLNMRLWWQLLRDKGPVPLHEAPYVRVGAAKA